MWSSTDSSQDFNTLTNQGFKETTTSTVSCFTQDTTSDVKAGEKTEPDCLGIWNISLPEGLEDINLLVSQKKLPEDMESEPMMLNTSSGSRKDNTLPDSMRATPGLSELLSDSDNNQDSLFSLPTSQSPHQSNLQPNTHYLAMGSGGNRGLVRATGKALVTANMTQNRGYVENLADFNMQENWEGDSTRAMAGVSDDDNIPRITNNNNKVSSVPQPLQCLSLTVKNLRQFNQHEPVNPMPDSLGATLGLDEDVESDGNSYVLPTSMLYPPQLSTPSQFSAVRNKAVTKVIQQNLNLTMSPNNCSDISDLSMELVYGTGSRNEDTRDNNNSVSSEDSVTCAKVRIGSKLGERPPCIGQESSPERRAVITSSINPIMPCNSCGKKVTSSVRMSRRPEDMSTTPRRLEIINTSLSSDVTTFMDRPIRHQLGVTENVTNKARRKSLVNKIRKIGKQIHSKYSKKSDRIQTLAVL